MAASALSYADLVTLLADQTSGAISPEDLRCLLMSTLGEYGSIYQTGNSTAQSQNNVAALYDAGVQTAGESNGMTVTATAGNRKLTAATAGIYQVFLTGIILLPESDDYLDVMIYKNGSAVTGLKARIYVGADGQRATVAISGFVSLAATDYLQVYIVNADASSNTVYFLEMNFNVRRVK